MNPMLTRLTKVQLQIVEWSDIGKNSMLVYPEMARIDERFL